MYRAALVKERSSDTTDGYTPDDNLDKHASLIIRGAVVATGIAGLLAFARSLRLFTQFTHARQIPAEFIRKNVQLRGVVAYLTQDGVIRVQHVPIFRSPLARFRRDTPKEEVGKLSVNVAGVEMMEAGKEWLRQQILLRPVGLTLIRRPNDDEIDCEIVVKKGRFRTYSVNRELVRRGLGRVPGLSNEGHRFALQTNPGYSRLIQQLLISERIADRRGVGVWKRQSLLEAVLSYPSQLNDRIRHTSVYQLIAILSIGLKHLAVIGYKTSRVAARSLVDAMSSARRISDKQ